MLAPLLIALMMAAPATEPAATPLPPAAERKAPASLDKAVDENGVPAWAKRKRLHPVQSCETKPNIGVETWRGRYDSVAPERLKPRPATSTCH